MNSFFCAPSLRKIHQPATSLAPSFSVSANHAALVTGERHTGIIRDGTHQGTHKPPNSKSTASCCIVPYICNQEIDWGNPSIATATSMITRCVVVNMVLVCLLSCILLNVHRPQFCVDFFLLLLARWRRVLD